MPEFFNKHRQGKNILMPSLFISLLIHGLVASALSRHLSPKPSQTKKPIEIIIVEQPQGRSPKNSTKKQLQDSQNAQPTKPASDTAKPIKSLKLSTADNLPSNAKSSSIQQPISRAKPATPPKIVKQSQPKTKPADQKPDLPLQTSTTTPSKLPKISSQANINQNIERSPDENKSKLEQVENIEQNIEEAKKTPKPPGNNDLARKKPVMSAFNKPVQPKTTRSPANSAFLSNSPNSSENGEIDGETTTNRNRSNSLAANTASDEPQAPLSVSCENNCQPEYPSALNGAEGSAGIRLIINQDGQVMDAAIAISNGNPELDREALQAAQQMEFSSIDRDRATVRINISFTVAGSDFEQQAKEEQEKRAEQEKERQEQ